MAIIAAAFGEWAPLTTMATISVRRSVGEDQAAATISQSASGMIESGPTAPTCAALGSAVFAFALVFFGGGEMAIASRLAGRIRT